MAFALLILVTTLGVVGQAAPAKSAKPAVRSQPGLISRAREKLKCESERVVRDMANIASDLSSSFNSALGFSDKCWTGSNGVSIITCEEVETADRTGFNSHYDYIPDPRGLSPNHRNCTIPEVPSILEDLMISDLAKEVEDSLDCQLPFLNELVDRPSSDQIQKFQDAAYAAYSKVLPDLAKWIPERDRLQHDADFGKGVCRGPAKEGYDPQMSAPCRAYRSESGQAGEARANELTRKIDLALSSVPMGVDPNVHTALLKLATAGASTKAAFLGGYRKPFKQIRDDSAGIKAQLKKARPDDGNQYYIEPLLRAQLLAIPNYKKIVESKTKLPPKVRGILTCLQDARETGAKRAVGLTVGAAAVSAAITMGASAGVIALGEGATAGLIALDLGITAIGNVQTVDAIASACYGSLQNYEPGKQCSVEQGMAVTVGRADRASCALNVAPVLAPTLIAGGSAVGKAVLKTAASDTKVAAKTVEVLEQGPAPVAERRVPPRGRRVEDIPAHTGIDTDKGLIERLSPAAARTRKRQDLVDVLEKKTMSTDKESNAYVAAALKIGPDDGAKFFYLENSALKEMNELYKDQNFVTAVTNLRLHLTNRRLRMAGFKIPDSKTLKNADYKALAKTWLDGLSPADWERVKEAERLAKQDWIDELERLKVVRSEDGIADKFRAGSGRTADEAASAARAARELPDTGVRDYSDPEVVAIMERNLQQAHETRRAVAERPNLQFLLEKTADGHLVPTRRAFVLMRKNATPEQLLAAIKKDYPQSTLTLEDARDLAAVNKAVDKWNPQLLNETRKVASLKQAKYGGASGDFCGMGAANNHSTACAIAGAATRDEALKLARAGERQITGEFKKKFAKWKEIMGSADCSGDDCVSAAQGRAWTRQEKQQRLNQLNNEPLTRDMRVAYASERVVDPNDVDKITYHGESIEQRLRAHLKEANFPRDRGEAITFAVDMDAPAAGAGDAAWLAGVSGKPLTAQEKATIDQAFAKAVSDVNEKLKKQGLKGAYRVGK